MAIALINNDGFVVTFLRDDLPDGWSPPDGFSTIPENDLPSGWQMAPEIHDMNEVRRERNEKLLASDWTQLSDSPANKEAWGIYRQSLRDLPNNYSGTGPIPWPSPPNFQ